MTHFPPTIATTLRLPNHLNEICVTVVRGISQRHEFKRSTFTTDERASYKVPSDISWAIWFIAWNTLCSGYMCYDFMQRTVFVMAFGNVLPRATEYRVHLVLTDNDNLGFRL